MTTTTDSNNVKLASSHKKSLTELSINDDNHINYNTDSNINDDQEKSKPLKKRKKNDLSRKRKSEAAIHINTSRLFPSQINGHNNKRNNNHSKKTYRHSHSQNNNQNGRKLKSRSFHDKENTNNNNNNNNNSNNNINIDDKYAPFDFNKLGSRQRSGTLQPKGVQFRIDKNSSLNGNTLRANKAVKFSGKDSKGISFRKSHNNLPIMHPDEIQAIQHSKKKKKNLYKQRASYSAAHFSRNKNQLLTQSQQNSLYNRSKHIQNGNNNKHNNNNHKLSFHHSSNKKIHVEDEQFLNSLVEPVKKKELNDAIEKLKQVIESSNLTNLVGSNIEMSLREVLRKLQLLRLDVTLREYRKSGTKSLNNTSEEDINDTTDDEYTHSIYLNDKAKSAKLGSVNGHNNKHKYNGYKNGKQKQSKPSLLKPQSNPIKKGKSKSVESLPKIHLSSDEENIENNDKNIAKNHDKFNDIQREKENKRILNVLNENKEHDGSTRDSSLVSALLFAAKYQHNQHFHPSIKVSNNGNNNNHNKKKITLKRRRFTLSAATPTESDRAGIEVARWLSTGYSTFGRYEIPPSPISEPILEPISINDMKPLKLNQDDKDDKDKKEDEDEDEIQFRQQAEKRRKLFEEKQRKLSVTKSDVNKFMKLVTSDQILKLLNGIGDNWDWCIFDLYEICGDQILLITAHFIFDQLNLFEKFNLNYSKFQSFFSVIQRGYFKNPYHSALHGADVLVNIYYWIKSQDFNIYLSDLDIIIALISAACHDFKHPGLTQNFQIATTSDLALKYNGRSVLENMHCSETIRLLLKPEYQIFASLKKSEFRYVRELITDMILGTDMQMHSDHVKKASSLINQIDKMENREENTKNILVIGLHVADIANPCKPWLDCKRWTYMLMDEWFKQGDKEKELSLEVSPMMDRNKPNIPRGQIGFIDYIVKPLFENWAKLFPNPTSICLKHLLNNKQNWTQLNSDPNANNVEFNLSNLKNAQKRKSKPIQINEPIHYNEDNNNSSNNLEYHAVIVTKTKSNKSKKKKRKKKKKKKKKDFEVALVLAATDDDDDNNNDNNKIKDVPFTPEQAHALNINYADVISSDNEETNDQNKDKNKNKIEQLMD